MKLDVFVNTTGEIYFFSRGFVKRYLEVICSIKLSNIAKKEI